jgi:spermidine synthase
MIPWETLERVDTAAGSTLTLHRRGEEYVIRIDGQDLMGSRLSGSERALAELGCARYAQKRSARVLVGGLGMGFTLRTTLDHLRSDASIEVAELVPEVVSWNRGVLAPLAGAPLLDPRVAVVERDVGRIIAESSRRYDAILLDVDNGPGALTSPANAHLYTPAGLARARAALRPAGTLAIWSAADDASFTSRLQRAGYEVAVERPLARHNQAKRGRKRHVLWLAVNPAH